MMQSSLGYAGYGQGYRQPDDRLAGRPAKVRAKMGTHLIVKFPADSILLQVQIDNQTKDYLDRPSDWPFRFIYILQGTAGSLPSIEHLNLLVPGGQVIEETFSLSGLSTGRLDARVDVWAAESSPDGIPLGTFQFIGASIHQNAVSIVQPLPEGRVFPVGSPKIAVDQGSAKDLSTVSWVWQYDGPGPPLLLRLQVHYKNGRVDTQSPFHILPDRMNAVSFQFVSGPWTRAEHTVTAQLQVSPTDRNAWQTVGSEEIVFSLIPPNLNIVCSADAIRGTFPRSEFPLFWDDLPRLVDEGFIACTPDGVTAGGIVLLYAKGSIGTYTSSRLAPAFWSIGWRPIVS